MNQRFFGLMLLVLAVALAALLLGETRLAPGAIWSGLVRGDGPEAFVLRQLRGPRVLTGLFAGAAFGLAGAVLQSLLRNPLASPDVMGVTAGAGFGAVLVLGFGGAAGLAPTFGAALGGLAAAALVAALSLRFRAGQIEIAPLRLILVGIGVGLTFTAATEFLMIRLPAAEAAQALRWFLGSLSARNWGHAGQIALCFSAFAALIALCTRSLTLLELGDDLATGLGANVRRSRMLLALLAVGLVASAIAVAGTVPFVALMAAPLARRILGPAPLAMVLAGAALTGAAITTLADLVARAAVIDTQLPLGVMTGLIGAPYLLWLLTFQIEKGRV